MEPQSLIHLFESSVEKFPDNVFLWEKRQNEYRGLTYQETAERVRHLGAGFLSLGLQKGERVALISEGRNDWVVSELAVLYCGAISVPLSVKLEESADLEFRLTHSGCRGIIVSAAHKHKVFALGKNLPQLEFVLLLDEGSKEQVEERLIASWKVLEIEDLISQGASFLQEHPQKLEDVKDSLMPGDYANICYTSGTTADPKGIILTHMNYLRNVQQASLIFDVPPYFTSLHILPWDHSFAHTVGIYALMRNGASLASLKLGKNPTETIRNIPVCIREVRPYFLLSVPALARNFRKNIEKGVRDKGAVAWWLFRQGLKVGMAYNREGHNRGKGSRAFLKQPYRFFDALIFKKIRENFGGRLRYFVGGGAMLDMELQRFFYAIGIPMYQGYGLTEAAPVISSNTPEFHKLGSSGKVVPMLDLKICNEQGEEQPIGRQGEILVRGDNVMTGYWQNPDASARALQDGWLHTGDLGYLDDDGYLFVLGRSKSLLIGSDGEKYSPEAIEEAMMAKSAYFEQVVLFNNQNPYTIALIVINSSKILDYLKKMNLGPDSQKGQLAALEKLRQEIQQFQPGGHHAGFPPRWLPAAAAFLVDPFSEKNKLMNSTMKIVRPAIVQQYQHIIDYLYTPEGKKIINQRNMDAIAALMAP